MLTLKISSLATLHISSVQQLNVASSYHSEQRKYRAFLSSQKVLLDSAALEGYLKWRKKTPKDSVRKKVFCQIIM